MELAPRLYAALVRPRFAVRRYLQRIVEGQFNFQGVTVLDFGSGTGSNAFLFSPEGYLGLDISPRRVAFARKKFPAYTFQVMRDLPLPAPANSFDFVCLFAVLHHLSDEQASAYLPELYRVLKPGGHIVCVEPCLQEGRSWRSSAMRLIDQGCCLRSEKEYRALFDSRFCVTVHRRFLKFFVYHEIFFSATLAKSNTLRTLHMLR